MALSAVDLPPSLDLDLPWCCGVESRHASVAGCPTSRIGPDADTGGLKAYQGAGVAPGQHLLSGGFLNGLRLKAAGRGERFFEAKACRACGGVSRYVSTGKCVACVKARSRAYQDEVLAKLRAAKENLAEVPRGELA